MSFEWYRKRIGWKILKYSQNHLGYKGKPAKYNGKAIADIPATAELLRQKIESGAPFCAARLGGTELRVMTAYQPECKNESLRKECRSNLVMLSGFFGGEEDCIRFVHLLEKSLSKVDLLGVWFNQMEDYMAGHYGSKELSYGLLQGIEPWYVPEKPWSAALAGKKVLVIHPFSESIERQYARREELFKGSGILPEFSLRTVKAVQTLAATKDERFASWFDALDYMCDEACREDFDIALIACGAYGMPLAARLKEAGHQAIHFGGALQLLFGIIGDRWEKMPEIARFRNEAWIRPAASERLSEAGNKTIENGCYW